MLSNDENMGRKGTTGTAGTFLPQVLLESFVRASLCVAKIAVPVIELGDPANKL